MVEFVAVGLVVQLILLSTSIGLGTAFRSQIAADTLGRQLLRNAQLGSESKDTIAKQMINLFGLDRSLVSFDIQDDCPNSGTMIIHTKVRDRSHTLKGFCLG